MKVLYIAGPIAGVKNYRERFGAAEAFMKARGWIALNPATLPAGMPLDRYMPICLAMVQAAEAVLLLDGWEDSPGATIERRFAEYQDKLIYLQSAFEYIGMDVPAIERWEWE